MAAVLSQAAVRARGHGAVSVLVANAGAGRRIRDVRDIGEDDWDAMLEVNARSAFVVTRACVEGINGCHYAASKGALT